MRRLLPVVLLLAACEDRPARLFEVEVLYAIHGKVTRDNYARIESLFSRAYPDLDVARLEQTIKEQQEYYAIYRDRLLKEAGTSAEAVREEELAAWKARGMAEVLGEDDLAFRKAVFDRGFALVQDQVDRELRVRGIFEYLLVDGRERGGVKAVFDHLAAKDDPKAPVCATEPGKGLLVYRHVTGTRKDLERLEDSGVRFTHNFMLRVVQTVFFDHEGDVPAFGRKADIVGDMGNGRCIYRVLGVHEPKTGDE